MILDILTGRIAPIVPIVGPFVGGSLIYASFQYETANSNSLIDIWRVSLTVGVGIFVTLVGIVYRNLDNRNSLLEMRVNSFRKRNERTIGVMMLLATKLPETSQREVMDAVRKLIDEDDE